MAKTKPNWSRHLGSPIYAETGSDSAFWFSPDAEALCAAEGILSGSSLSIYSATYGSDKIEKYRRKYRLASEIYASFSDSGSAPNIFEFLQGFDVRGFTLAGFREHILSTDRDKLPGMLLDLPISKIEDVTGREDELFKSYLGAAAYFNHTEQLIAEIFALAEELQTDAFYNTLDRYKKMIGEAQTNTAAALAKMTALEYSDKLLHKNMRYRGPFDFFIFAPTLFLRFRAVRYIGADQFLFFAIQDAVYDNEHLLRQLKALADDTRFRIAALLKERGGLQGSEIAHITGLTAATVSHHMKVLREAGLMHEETDGTTKIYSLPTNAAQVITDALKKILP